MLERIIFNILAFSLFVIVFFVMLRKNDTNYVVILILEAIGIAIGFIELLLQQYFGMFIRVLTYILAVLIPVIIVAMAKYNIEFSENLYIFFAKVCMFFNDNKNAKELLLKVTDRNAENYKSHILLAEIYEKEGGMRKAIDEYVKAIDINKQDYDSYYRIAFLLEKLGKKDESIEMLNNLIKKKPDYYAASELLGRLLCEEENFKEAINVYMNALKYNPSSYEIYYNLGIAYTRLNDFGNAKICYEKAAQINSALYNGYYNLGLISMLYNDLEEAERYFMEAVKGKDVEADGYYNLARIYAIKGEKEKAINYLNLAVELNPKLSKKAMLDPVFIPIQRFIPQNLNEQQDVEECKMETKEIKAKEHLETTYEVAGTISKNEYKKMNTTPNPFIQIEEKEQEQEKEQQEEREKDQD